MIIVIVTCSAVIYLMPLLSSVCSHGQFTLFLTVLLFTHVYSIDDILSFPFMLQSFIGKRSKRNIYVEIDNFDSGNLNS